MEAGEYSRIRDRLLKKRQLFEDPYFPATARSINPEGTAPDYIRWKRPKELISDPQFIVEGATRYDLYQGELGDCWFVAATASMAIQNRKILARCVPHDQDFNTNYAGIFRFNFWRFDRWVEVIVDDRLPTVQGSLMYAQNRSQPNEFWVPLLEKAYAKLHGCYQAIDGGHMNDALVDFTGGISERYDLTDGSKVPGNFFTLLTRTFRMNSMVGCSIRTRRIREESLTNGLYRGHAYSITALEQIIVQGREVNLLRLRNPWGKGEWNGKWSDYSMEWNSVLQRDRDRLLKRQTEGEFWIEYDDWLREFDDSQMCHLSPDAHTDEVAKDMDLIKWRQETHHGEWVRGLTAGGCGNPPDQALYWTNPQFSVTLSKADDGDRDGKCTVVVSLMQKDEDLSLDLYISFTIFKLRSGHRRLLDGSNYDQYALKMAERPGKYMNLREVTARFVLEPGTYVIIPATYAPHKESQFLLRVFSETPTKLGPVDSNTRDNRPAERDEDKALRDLFLRYSGNESRMDSEELMTALNDLFSKEYGSTGKFGIESARSVLAMQDRNKTGLIDFDEFKKMWTELKVWINAFKTYDTNQSNGIETYELTRVFERIEGIPGLDSSFWTSRGFTISRQVLSSVVKRYGGKKNKLTLEDFIHCLSKLVVMYRAFLAHSKNGIDGKAEIGLEEWMAVTLYY